METPFAPREYTSTLSAMYRGDNGPARGHGFAGHSSGLSPSTASMPLSIPSASSLGDVPPPLPPPRYVPGADGPRMEYRGPLRPDDDDIPHYKRRDMRDEGYHSVSSTNSSRGFEPFPPPAGREPLRPHGFGLHHNHYQFNSGADSYDNAMVKSFDVRRALDNRSPPLRSALSLSAQDPSTRPQERLSLLKPLSLPTRAKQQPTTDSPNRLLETPLSSAASPLNPPPFGRAEYYSPSGLMDPDRSPRSGRANSGSIPDDATVSSRGDGYYNEQEFVSDDRLSRSEFQAVGHKRRASSPAGEQASVHSIPSPGDRLRRNEGLSRGSPTPRLAVVPQGSTPMSSGTRNGSYASGLSLTASNMSSMHSYNHGRRSPGGLSPGGTSPTDQSSSHSPYETGSLTTSPRSSISTGPHHRTLSEQNRQVMSPRKLPDMLKPTASKIQGFFMCDCCPKKPKKFETVEELRSVPCCHANHLRAFLLTQSPSEFMSLKSSMSAPSAATDSKIRTRRSGIKARCTCGDIAGLVPRSLAMTGHSTHPRRGQGKQIRVAIAVTSFREVGKLRAVP